MIRIPVLVRHVCFINSPTGIAGMMVDLVRLGLGAFFGRSLAALRRSPLSQISKSFDRHRACSLSML
jgi:hypothetical protein